MNNILQMQVLQGCLVLQCWQGIRENNEGKNIFRELPWHFLALILFLSKAHPNLERKDAKCFIAMCLSGDV